MKHLLLLLSLLIFLNAFRSANYHRVAGTIKGSVGEPIVNAIVTEKGNDKNKVTSDHLGRYTIRVSSPKATLIVKSFAYATIEVQVKGRKVVNVRLEPEQEKPWDSKTR